MSQLRSAGTPKYELLTLQTKNGERVNLEPLLVSLDIFEDIFSPTLTGKITIEDSIGMFDQLPLTGMEKFIFKGYSYNYSEDNEDVNFLHKIFDIIRITDVVQINDYTKSYTLHFVSQEYMRNELIKLSKGYTNQSISDVVEDLMTSNFDSTDEERGVTGLGYGAEPSDFSSTFIPSPYIYSTDYVRFKRVNDDEATELFIEKTRYTEPELSFPYMKPFDIISWLSTRAFRKAAGRYGLTQQQDAANFLFFENKRGYNFVSVETLLEGKEISFTKFKYGSGKQNSFKNSRKVEPETILNLEIQDCYNILRNIREGLYSSKLISYDLATGISKIHDFDYIDQFYKSESTERVDNDPNIRSDYPLIPIEDTLLSQSYNSRRMFVVNSPQRIYDTITSDYSHRSNDVYEQSGAEAYLQKRLSQLLRLSNFRMIFEISGNTKHKVGDMVEVDIQSAEFNQAKAKFTQNSNKYYSGFYLITSIQHKFTQDEYLMNIEAVKDSFREPITQSGN